MADDLLAAYASWTSAAFEAAGGPAGFARLVQQKAVERLEADSARAHAAGDQEQAASVGRNATAWRRYTIPSGTRSSWRPTPSRPRPTVPPPHLRAFFVAVVVDLVPVNPVSPEQFPDFQIVMRGYARQQLNRVGRPPSRVSSPSEPSPPEERDRRPELGDNQRLAEQTLMWLPDYFPDHLTVEGFAALGRVAPVADFPISGIDRPGLYSDFTPYSTPEPALPLLSKKRRVVLLGDPGCGKSTLLCGLGIETIRHGGATMVFARLEDVGRIAAGTRIDGPGAAAQVVVAAFFNWLGQEPTSGLATELAGRLLDPGCEVVVALDGLDEVSEPGHQQGAVDVMSKLDALEVALIVSSRITGYTKPLASLEEHVVLPLDRQGPGQLVESWFRDGHNPRGRDAAFAALEDPGLAEIASNQLISGFICFVAERERVATTKYGLYRQYLHQFLTRRWKPSIRRSMSAVEGALTTARQVGWAMATRQTARHGHPAWLDTARLGWLAAASSASRKQLLELYLTDGILVAFGPPDDTDPMTQPVRWLHRTIHEHLVGRELAQQLLNELPRAGEILRQGLLRPTWRVPLEHCAGALAELGILDKVADDLWAEAGEWDTLRRQRAVAISDLLQSGGSDHLLRERQEALAQIGDWSRVDSLDQRGLVGLLAEAHTPLTRASAEGFESLIHALARQVQKGALSWKEAENVEERLLARLPGLSRLYGFRCQAWRGFSHDADGFADWALTEIARPASEQGWMFGASSDPRLAAVVVDRIEGSLATAGTSDDWVREIDRLHDLVREEDRGRLIENASRVRVATSFVVEYVKSRLSGELFDFTAVKDDDLGAVLRGDLGNHVAFGAAAELTERTGRDLTTGSRWGLLGTRVAREPWNVSRPPSLDPVHQSHDLATPERGPVNESFMGWQTNIDAAETLLATMEEVTAAPTTAKATDMFRRLGESRMDDETGAVWVLDASWYQGFLASLPPDVLMEAALGLRDEWGQEEWAHLAMTAIDSAYRADHPKGLELLTTFLAALVAQPAERDVFHRLTLWTMAEWTHDDAVEAARRALVVAGSSTDEVWRIELAVWAEDRLYAADVLDVHATRPNRRTP